MNNLRLFESALNDPLENMFKRFMAPVRMELERGSLDIKLDVTETDGVYKVCADLPGVKKEDINVRIDGNLIQIDAQAKQENEEKDSGGKVLRSERWQGTVSRAFSLAQDVDETQATAKYEDGVLILELPKKESSGSKRLEVQ